MVRRRTALLALLVLPALVLRALVPVGFMPVIDGAGIHIGFCPGEAQPPGALSGALAAAHPAHHHHHGGADHGSPASASHPPCLFAASATLATAPAAAALCAPVAARSRACTHEQNARPFVPSILRTQSPRAPPPLANL
jgi:hypothetical protein